MHIPSMQRTGARLVAAAGLAGALTAGVSGVAQASSSTALATSVVNSSEHATVAHATQIHAAPASTSRLVRFDLNVTVPGGGMAEIPTWFFGSTDIDVTNVGHAWTYVKYTNPATGDTWYSPWIPPGGHWHDSGHFWGVPLNFYNLGTSPVYVVGS